MSCGARAGEEVDDRGVRFVEHEEAKNILDREERLREGKPPTREEFREHGCSAGLSVMRRHVPDTLRYHALRGAVSGDDGAIVIVTGDLNVARLDRADCPA